MSKLKIRIRDAFCDNQSIRGRNFRGIVWYLLEHLNPINNCTSVNFTARNSLWKRRQPLAKDRGNNCGGCNQPENSTPLCWKIRTSNPRKIQLHTTKKPKFGCTQATPFMNQQRKRCWKRRETKNSAKNAEDITQTIYWKILKMQSNFRFDQNSLTHKENFHRPVNPTC